MNKILSNAMWVLKAITGLHKTPESKPLFESLNMKDMEEYRHPKHIGIELARKSDYCMLRKGEFGVEFESRCQYSQMISGCRYIFKTKEDALLYGRYASRIDGSFTSGTTEAYIVVKTINECPHCEQDMNEVACRERIMEFITYSHVDKKHQHVKIDHAGEATVTDITDEEADAFHLAHHGSKDKFKKSLAVR